MVALLGIGLAQTGQSWKSVSQQQKELELLFVGDQFRRAILLYYERTPSLNKQYPKKLTDLIKDDRYPSVQRYLRKIYRDPITGKKEWGVVLAPEGGIMGVYSLSSLAPRKTGNFSAHYESFEGSLKYSDWKFVYRPTLLVTN